jgi:hypothetical protein
MRCSAILVLALGVACGPGASDDDDGDGSTGSECDECELDPLVEAVASTSEQPTMDCGTLVYDADVADWTAGRDCVMAALTAQMAVELRWMPQVIDSVHYTAFVGTVAESYAITEIDWDCYQGDVMASQRPCDSVAPIEDCTVEVGFLCLECVSTVDSTVLCE